MSKSEITSATFELLDAQIHQVFKLIEARIQRLGLEEFYNQEAVIDVSVLLQDAQRQLLTSLEHAETILGGRKDGQN